MVKRSDRLTATGGSGEREPRSVTAPLMRFELAEEAASLRAEAEYLEGDRNAKTLVKAGAFRLVLVALRLDAAVEENDQRGSLALQVLEGRMALRVGEHVLEIETGEVGAVSPDHPWTATALSDCLLLLHLSWPPEPGSLAATR